MDYYEANALLQKHKLFDRFGIHGYKGSPYMIEFKVISTNSTIWEIKKLMDANSGNNKMALIELGLFNNDNLRVKMVAKLEDGSYYEEDLYNYLLDSSQLI